MLRGSKVIAEQTETQTDRQTDNDQKHYLLAYAGGNNNIIQAGHG